MSNESVAWQADSSKAVLHITQNNGGQTAPRRHVLCGSSI